VTWTRPYIATWSLQTSCKATTSPSVPRGRMAP
jgi:hypothetical protein